MASTFGRFIESDAAVNAEWDADPKAVNQFDVGWTHARTATEIRGGVARLPTHPDDLPEHTPRLAVGAAVRMSPVELALLEAREARDAGD